MRSIQVQVPRQAVCRVLALAAEHDADDPIVVRAERRSTGAEPTGAEPTGGEPTGAEPTGGEPTGGEPTGLHSASHDGDLSLVLVTIPNDRAGGFIAAVTAEVGDAGFVLLPVGALPLSSPLDRLAGRVRDVSRLSTLELVAASLQSVGAWRGLLLFSVLAGVVGAYGLIFDVAYLLVAAMLINPMGAPALVSVVALGIGDGRMFARGGWRFAVSLVVQAAAALALGFGYGLQVSTAMMEQVTALSTWAVVVALAAGAAGAQAQVKSERDSLVSGTAAGFMVAAALAPPAAVLGLSVPLGRWDYFTLMAFLLALQYLAIALGGWLVLHAFGIRPADPSIGRGTARTRTALVAAVALVTLGLVAWQTRLEPSFTRADLSRDALVIARDAVDRTPGAAYIQSTARFTRRDLVRHPGQTLLFDVVVERTGEHGDDLESAIRRAVRALVADRMTGVVPFVRVTVLPGPEGPAGP